MILRSSHKKATPQEWKDEDIIPLDGEIVIYSIEDTVRLKVGDGVTNVNDLPFADASIIEELNTKVPRIVDIDKADWEEDFEKNVAAGMPEDWINWSGTFTVEGKKYTKSAGNGFAYDYNNNNRVYVEKSTSGWNGNGGGVYNKYPLTASPDKVPDPDPKDWIWGTDSNGNTVPVAPKSYMQSIPMRYQSGDILVPAEPSYNNSAISKTYADKKNIEVKEELLNSSANAIKATAEGSLLILDDINPSSATLKVASETPGTKIYVHGKNLARSSTETASGTGQWTSTGYSIHPIKHKTYILSCDFERISGTAVGIAIKPNGSSAATEPSSTEASGTLTMTLDVGDANTISLMFYSNYSGASQTSECKFTNIVCRLADMEVEPGTEGYAEQGYSLDEEDGDKINIPSCSPALIYNPDSEVLHVEYSKDINKHFTSYLNTMSIADEERLKLYEDYNAENDNVRPFNQELYDDLIATERVYVEDDNHGGINPLYPLSLSRNYIPYNPWGFRTAEECGNRPYIEKTDAEGNTTYHPAMGAIMCMRSDGNAKVLGTPSDNKDVVPLGFANQHYPNWDNAISGKYSLPIKTRCGTKKWIKGTEYQDTDVEDVSIPLRHKGGIIKTASPQSPADAANKHYVDNNATSVKNVTELPTSNINTNKIYNLYTATFIHNRHVVDNSKCYIVDNRPEVGEPATNLERTTITAYYDLSDGKVYGYLDETLAAGFTQLAGTTIVTGWYPAEQLLPIAGWTYDGVITDIGDDSNDSTIRLLLEKKVYIYQNGWIELTNSIVEERLPTPSANGHFAYTVQRREGVDAYELHLISHSINDVYPYQIPLRTNGIIKVAKPQEFDDAANKQYVDNEITDKVANRNFGNPKHKYHTTNFYFYLDENNQGNASIGLHANAEDSEQEHIPLRQKDGSMTCNVPDNAPNNTVINKKYVDDKIGALENVLDNILLAQENIIGG